MEVAWTQTPQEYYDKNVHEIFDMVVESLMQDKNRKFTISEIYFFEKWWN